SSGSIRGVAPSQFTSSASAVANSSVRRRPSIAPISSVWVSHMFCSPARRPPPLSSCEACSAPIPRGSRPSIAGPMDAGSLPSTVDSKDRRLYFAVMACALVPYVPALWNGFALDDLYIIVWNPLVHSGQGAWRAFAAPYWPPDLGGQMYRPLPLASFAVDWAIARGHPAWFHSMNLLWHAGVAVLVAAVVLRWADWAAALAAGLVFAVHPIHVEAVANVIGLGELMAAAGACLTVYAAVVRQDLLLSGAALVLGLLSKENAVVAPVLIVWAWVVGPPAPLPPRPAMRRILAFVVSWVVIAGAYLAVRGFVLHPYARLHAIAPVFVGESAIAGRLTAIAALGDVL